MNIVLQFKGSKFRIYSVILDNGSCPSIEFLEDLRKNRPKSYKSMVNLYIRHANYGEIRDKKKSRSIKGFPGLYEYKTNQGDRLLYCYLVDWKIVLLCGFHKSNFFKNEYQKAKDLMDKCMELEK